MKKITAIIFLILIVISCTVNQEMFYHLDKKYVKANQYHDPTPKLTITKEGDNYIMFDPVINKTDTLSFFRGKVDFFTEDYDFTDYGDSLYFENYRYIYKWYYR